MRSAESLKPLSADTFASIDISDIPEDVRRDIKISVAGLLKDALKGLPLLDPQVIRHPDGAATYSVRIDKLSEEGRRDFSVTYAGMVVGGQLACSGEVFFSGKPEYGASIPYVGGVRVQSFYGSPRTDGIATLRQGFTENRLYPTLNSLSLANYQQPLHSGDHNELTFDLWKKKLVAKGVAERTPGRREEDRYAFRFKDTV